MNYKGLFTISVQSWVLRIKLHASVFYKMAANIRLPYSYPEIRESARSILYPVASVPQIPLSGIDPTHMKPFITASVTILCVAANPSVELIFMMEANCPPGFLPKRRSCIFHNNTATDKSP